MTATETVSQDALPLQTQRIGVKFFLNDDSFDIDHVVPVFHRWIQQRVLPEHQLIDVGDYKHVVNGPGIVLVAHEANIYLDVTSGELGLLYVRKQAIEGNFTQRLRKILSYTAGLGKLLEDDASLTPRLKFGTDRLLLRLNDRLLAPPTAETLKLAQGGIEQALTAITGSPVTIKHDENPYMQFQVNAKLSGVSLDALI